MIPPLTDTTDYMQYLLKENDNLLNRIDESITEYVKLIDEKYFTTCAEFKAMDICLKAQYFTIDVVSTLTFRQSFGDYHADHTRLGSSNTTATAIRVILLRLSTNAPVLEKFLADIATHSPSSPGGESEAKSMPYLRSIIN